MSQELGINIGLASERYIRYDRGISSSIKQRVRSINLGGTYEERTPDGINIIEETFSASFSNRSYDEITDLIDFFDSKNGVESFLLHVKDSSSVDGARSVPVVCENYNVTYINKAIATLTCSFIKVVTTEFNDDIIYQNLTEFTQGQYTVLSSTSEAYPGQEITFTINTINVPNGSEVAFQVAGVSVSDFTTDFETFQVFDGTASIVLTLEQNYQGSLPTELVFSLSDYPTASVTVSIFELLPVVPTFETTKQGNSPQQIDITFKSDGRVLLDGAFQSFWINNPDSFDASNYQIKFDEDVSSSTDATSSSTPVSAIGSYTSLSSDVTLSVVASAPNNTQYTEIHNVSIKDIASQLEYSGILTRILKGSDFVTPTYTLELRNIVENTTDALFEGSTVEIDLTSNQYNTLFKWDITPGTATSPDYTGTIAGEITTDGAGYALIEGPSLVDDIDTSDEAFTVNLRDYNINTILATQQVTIRELEGGIVAPPAPKLFYVNFTMYNSSNPNKSPEAGDVLYPVYSDAGIGNYTSFREMTVTDETEIYYYIGEGDLDIADFLEPGFPTATNRGTITLAPGGNVTAGTVTVKNPIPEDVTIKVYISTPNTLASGTFAMKSFDLKQLATVSPGTITFPPFPFYLAADTTTVAPGVGGSVGLTFKFSETTFGNIITAQAIADGQSYLLATAVSGTATDWFISRTSSNSVPNNFTEVAGSLGINKKVALNLNPKIKYNYESSTAGGLESFGGLIKLYHISDLNTPLDIPTSQDGATDWNYILSAEAKVERRTVSTPITFNISTNVSEAGYIQLDIWLLNNGTLVAKAIYDYLTLPTSEIARQLGVPWDSDPDAGINSTLSQGNDFRIVSTSANVSDTEVTRQASANTKSLYTPPASNLAFPSQLPHLSYRFTMNPTISEARSAKVSDVLTIDSASYGAANTVQFVVNFRQNELSTVDDSSTPASTPTTDTSQAAGFTVSTPTNTGLG